MSVLRDIEALKKVLNDGYDYLEKLQEHGIVQDDVKKLRIKLSSSKVVPKVIFDKYLLLGLVACDRDVTKAAELFEELLKLRRCTPEFYASRDLTSPELQKGLDTYNIIPLAPTPKNQNLILVKLRNCDPKAYEFDDFVKLFMMTIGEFKYILLSFKLIQIASNF